MEDERSPSLLVISPIGATVLILVGAACGLIWREVAEMVWSWF